jgi:hypothetical protein
VLVEVARATLHSDRMRVFVGIIVHRVDIEKRVVAAIKIIRVLPRVKCHQIHTAGRLRDCVILDRHVLDTSGTKWIGELVGLVGHISKAYTCKAVYRPVSLLETVSLRRALVHVLERRELLDAPGPSQIVTCELDVMPSHCRD